MKRKGARPIMKDRPFKGYIDLYSEGRKDLREWVELAPRLNEELVSKKKYFQRYAISSAYTPDIA